MLFQRKFCRPIYDKKWQGGPNDTHQPIRQRKISDNDIFSSEISISQRKIEERGLEIINNFLRVGKIAVLKITIQNVKTKSRPPLKKKKESVIIF